MSHHVEVFREDDGTWGYQCFEPQCGEEAVGFEDFDSADAAGEEHSWTDL